MPVGLVKTLVVNINFLWHMLILFVSVKLTKNGWFYEKISTVMQKVHMKIYLQLFLANLYGKLSTRIADPDPHENQN